MSTITAETRNSGLSFMLPAQADNIKDTSPCLYQGDAIKRATLLKDSVDLVITSPLYGSGEDKKNAE